MAVSEQWELTAGQRVTTVERITASITNLAFARGVVLSLDDARKKAVTAEKTAHTTAQVESRTTTGSRPASESLQAYARKLGTLVLEAAQQAGNSGVDHDAAAANGAAKDTLDLTGDRAFLSRDVAEDALAPLLAEGAVITKIKLSTKSFNAEAAEVLAKGIDNVRGTLVEADLSDVIAGRPEDEALAALRIISEAAAAHGKLEALNLSDNALGEKGVRAFAAGLSSQAALQRLAFQNVGASIKACEAIAELLPRSQALRQLHLFNNMSGDEGAAAIAQLLARSPAMADFRMASSRVGADGAAALAQGLSAGDALQRLDISDNPLTEEAAEALADMLRRHTRLVDVNLSDTGLGPDGVSAVVEALQPSTASLQGLNLALNEVGAEGAEAVATFLRSATALQRLNLRENELEDDGALAIAAALPSLSQLQELDLSGNQLHRRGAVAVAKAAAALPQLRSLLLDENEISEAGISDVKAALAAAGKGDALGSLEENDAEADEDDEGGEEVEDLADKLSHATL